MSLFGYDDAVVGRFPTIRAGVVRATGVSNGVTPAELGGEYRAEQEAVLRRLGDTPLAEVPSIAAWRQVFAQFGAKPTQYRNAAEALLRRLVKQGDIPSIGTLVDLGNLVSIRHAMPVAVVDVAGIDGGLTVRFATGDEAFSDLGSSTSTSPEPGEVVFVDRSDVVSARRWCWRQSAQGATGPTTAEAFFVVEGHHDSAAEDVDAALADLTSLLAKHQPDSSTTSYRLSPTTPSTDA